MGRYRDRIWGDLPDGYLRRRRQRRDYQSPFGIIPGQCVALNGAGQGTYESVGKHKWRTANVAEVSDGRRIRAEGEIDLASRSWKGKLFEMS